MKVGGIDPGITGAITVIDTSGTVRFEIWDMPTLEMERGGKNKRDVDPHQVATVLSESGVDHVFVEKQWSMPGQGVSGVGSLMRGYGILLGVLAALRIPYTEVPSQTWKKQVGTTIDKERSRQRASQLMPGASKMWPNKGHHGRAESALIAYYGVQILTGSAETEPYKQERRESLF